MLSMAFSSFFFVAPKSSHALRMHVATILEVSPLNLTKSRAKSSSKNFSIAAFLSAFSYYP